MEKNKKNMNENKTEKDRAMAFTNQNFKIFFKKLEKLKSDWLSNKE